ncbi:hypothetical protein HPB52_012921 [Rhipicephalus sanguineus]|uniref:Uncharacterized protein n=1 Tax=Rhipicephalus sanguineus TaxID=34632 RepID=A0A9D4Q712_RHISA|nr:hypothetical protein HPB52_012921 [Rhipicephalus sanguineus]
MKKEAVDAAARAWALLRVTPQDPISSYKFVDLSHHNAGTIYWDDDASYRLNVTVYNATRAEWLQVDMVEEPIHGGLDTASVDASGDGAHGAILEANMFVIENLANLEKLPILGSYALALPLLLDGGSASPVRIVAMVPR